MVDTTLGYVWMVEIIVTRESRFFIALFVSNQDWSTNVQFLVEYLSKVGWQYQKQQYLDSSN